MTPDECDAALARAARDPGADSRNLMLAVLVTSALFVSGLGVKSVHVGTDGVLYLFVHQGQRSADFCCDEGAVLYSLEDRGPPFACRVAYVTGESFAPPDPGDESEDNVPLADAIERIRAWLATESEAA